MLQTIQRQPPATAHHDRHGDGDVEGHTIPRRAGGAQKPGEVHPSRVEKICVKGDLKILPIFWLKNSSLSINFQDSNNNTGNTGKEPAAGDTATPMKSSPRCSSSPSPPPPTPPPPPTTPPKKSGSGGGRKKSGRGEVLPVNFAYIHVYL